MEVNEVNMRREGGGFEWQRGKHISHDDISETWPDNTTLINASNDGHHPTHAGVRAAFYPGVYHQLQTRGDSKSIGRRKIQEEEQQKRRGQ